MSTFEDTDETVLKVNFVGCPVLASLGILGHKWALIVLRNIALYRKQRFNEMLKMTPGLTKRVLSMRLKELESDNFITVVEKDKNMTRWDLTEKGRDSLSILMVLVQFGSKYYADKVFKDKKPRALEEVFEESYIHKIMDPMFPEIENAHKTINKASAKSSQTSS